VPVLRTGSLFTSGILASFVALSAAAPAAAQPDLSHEQWALEAVAAQEAWEHGTGVGVSVAVLDSGVDHTHPDLGFVDEDADTSAVTVGEDFTGGGGDAAAGHGGTTLAGIIAARGHGAEFSGGVLGMAPEAEILALRVMEEGQPPEGEALASALRQATSDGAQVALLPPAPDPVPAEVEHAIDYAQGNGVVVVAPADGPGYEEALSVGAVGLDLTVPESSTIPVTLVAPGQDITTIDVNGGYTEVSGADSAAALVAGTAALVRSAHPRLQPAQVAEALREGASLPETVQDADAYGAGVLHAEQAMIAAERLADEAPPIDAAPPPAEEDEGVSLWLAVTGGVLLATAVVLGVILLRRRWSDPYQLAEPEADPEPRSGRRAAGRRGRRVRARGARRS
jgi:subtilisin family serine protease